MEQIHSEKGAQVYWKKRRENILSYVDFQDFAFSLKRFLV